jgi:hypothetical protein
MRPRAKLLKRALFGLALSALGIIPATGQSRLSPFIAGGIVHDFSGRQESPFLSLPVFGGGVLFRLGQAVSLGIEAEYARLGGFVAFTESVPGDPNNPELIRHFSTAANTRLCGLAHIRISQKPAIPYLVLGAGYYQTKESRVPAVRDEFNYKGIGANAGVGWRITSFGGPSSLNVESRAHFAIGEAHNEVGFSLYLTLNIVVAF